MNLPRWSNQQVETYPTNADRLYAAIRTNRTAGELASVEAWFFQPADLEYELSIKLKGTKDDA
jgi:hypothetical protein